MERCRYEVFDPGRGPALDRRNRQRRGPLQPALRADDRVRTFVAASDIYQTCLSSSLLTSNTQRLIAANQQDKERVVNAFNAAARRRT